MEGVYGASAECREYMAWIDKRWDSQRPKREYYIDAGGKSTK